MRLIYIPEFELDTIDGELPEYAILSHTWGSEEITFCDFEKLARKLRPPNEVHTDYLEYVTQFCKDKGKNFDKILGACKAAQQNNLDYLWVDTCCIDKSSSSELSESINSMFAWYEGAALCLAHLNDFKKTPRDFDPESFAKCRWFTRAWTLQELIAPQQVYFYNREWAPLGNKMLFARLLYDITKIETTFLTKETSIRTASVAKRMSWAAFREATREEDRAYSLLGIFGVNMPLIYGERSNSFIRLQEEILKEIDDHSIFAWIESPQIAQKGIITNCGHPKCLKPACDISICRNPSCTNPTCILFRETGHLKGCKVSRKIRGILATSPDCFFRTGNITSFPQATAKGGHITITNRGIYMPSMLSSIELRSLLVPVLKLNCVAPNKVPLSICLHHEAGDQYTRAWPECLLYSDLRSEGYAGFYALKTLSTFRSRAGNSLENSIFLKILNESVSVWDIPAAQFTANGERYFPTGSRVPYQNYLVVSTEGFLLKIWFGTKSEQGKDHEILPWCKCELLSEFNSHLSMRGVMVPSLSIQQGLTVHQQPHMYSSPPMHSHPPTCSQPVMGSRSAVYPQPPTQSCAPIDSQTYVPQRPPVLLEGRNSAALDHGLRWSLRDCNAFDEVDIKSNVSLCVNITQKRREGYDTFDLVICTLFPY